MKESVVRCRFSPRGHQSKPCSALQVPWLPLVKDRLQATLRVTESSSEREECEVGRLRQSYALVRCGYETGV